MSSQKWVLLSEPFLAPSAPGAGWRRHTLNTATPPYAIKERSERKEGWREVHGVFHAAAPCHNWCPLGFPAPCSTLPPHLLKNIHMIEVAFNPLVAFRRAEMAFGTIF